MSNTRHAATDVSRFAANSHHGEVAKENNLPTSCSSSPHSRLQYYDYTITKTLRFFKATLISIYLDVTLLTSHKWAFWSLQKACARGRLNWLGGGLLAEGFCGGGPLEIKGNMWSAEKHLHGRLQDDVEEFYCFGEGEDFIGFFHVL